MSITAMKQALEVLEKAVSTCFDKYSHEQVMGEPSHFINKAITALRQAIEQAERKRVGWLKPCREGWFPDIDNPPAQTGESLPLYLHPTAPAQPNHDHLAESYQQGWQAGNKAAPAQQQPLTTKQIAEYLETATLDYRVVSFIDGARFAEKHHGIKGASL